MAANHSLWKKQGVRLVESDGTEPAPQQQAQAQDQAPAQRAPNTIPGTTPGPAGSAPVQVADASGKIVPQQPGATPQPPAPKPPAAAPVLPGQGSVGSSLRDILLKRMPAYQRQYESAVGGMIKAIAGAAEKGFLPPEEGLREAIDAVKQSGNPALAEQLQQATNTAQFVAEQRASKPEDLRAWATAERAHAMQSGAANDQISRIEHAEKLADSIDAHLKDDPVSWAVSTSVIPEQAPITAGHFTQDALNQRAQTVAGLSKYYGRDLPFFEKDERDAIKAVVYEGGDKAIQALGMMNEAFGPVMKKAMTDISKEAPEAAWLGSMIASKASPQAIKDMAYGLKLKHSEDFKPIAPDKNLARTTALGVFGTAFKALSQTEDNAIAMANMLYEVRARQKGVVSDTKGAIGDPELWTQGLKEVLGETKDPVSGTTYGGIYQQGAFMRSVFGGHYQQNIAVPANVRQNAVPDLVNALKIGDLVDRMPQLPESATKPEQGAPGVPGIPGTPSGPSPAVGLPGPVIGLPLDSRGRPISLGDFRTANLVSVGDGKYALAMGDPNGEKPDWVVTNGPNRDREGRFVLDIKALEPILKARVPSAYRPY